MVEKSQFFGKYCQMRPLVFLLVPHSVEPMEKPGGVGDQQEQANHTMQGIHSCVVDNLGHGGVRQESGVLVAKEGGEKIPKYVGNVVLDMSWEFGEPGTKRLTITNGLGQRNVETVALEDRDQTGIPEKRRQSP
jgi:hypothetical protein